MATTARITHELGDLSSPTHSYNFKINGRDWVFEVKEFLLRDFVAFLHESKYYENAPEAEKVARMREAVISFLSGKIKTGGTQEEFRHDIEDISPEKLNLISEAVLTPILKYTDELEEAAKKKARAILRAASPWRRFFGFLRGLFVLAKADYRTKN